MSLVDSLIVGFAVILLIGGTMVVLYATVLGEKERNHERTNKRPKEHRGR